MDLGMKEAKTAKFKNISLTDHQSISRVDTRYAVSCDLKLTLNLSNYPIISIIYTLIHYNISKIIYVDKFKLPQITILSSVAFNFKFNPV